MLQQGYECHPQKQNDAAKARKRDKTAMEKWQMPAASPFNLVISSQFSGRDAVGGMTSVFSETFS